MLAAVARSPYCPPEHAAQAEQNVKIQGEIKDRILAASKRVRTDERGFTLWNTPKGQYWVPNGSDYVLPWNLAEQERKIYGSGEHFVHPGDIVLDCGANMGVFTREALNAGAKLVVAIEPAPENIEALKRNFAEEIKAGKVIVYPKGVWDKDDWLTMNISPENSAADSFVIHPAGSQTSAVKLPLTTIDKLAAELKLPSVDFIKMDIEGAEPRALRGGHATLAKHRPRLAISVYHQPTDPVTVPRAIKAAWPGYRMAYGPCEKQGDRIFPDIYYFY